MPGRRLIVILGLLLIAAIVAPVTAVAQTKVYDQMSDEEVIGFLKDNGIECELAKEGAIRLVLGGTRCVLANKKTNMYLFFYRKGSPGPARINEWNKSKRFSHAHVDPDGDSILESDLDLEGGITRERFLSFVKTFQTLVQSFQEFLAQ